MNRRHFFASLAAGAFVGLLPHACRSDSRQPSRRLRILVLGGTNFVGPHLVEAALDRGHEVTLFNRGISNTHLFPELELLRGNRYPDREAGLTALETTRTWDAVFDTWQEAPGCVDLTAGMLADRAEHYVYISSIATYRHYRERGMTEDGPLLDSAGDVESFASDLAYPRRKRAGEQAVEQQFGSRGVVLRCTSIGGRNRSGDARAHAGHWAYRFLTGQSVLVPDDATARVQLIDVEDMAAFAIAAVEQGFGGAFNMVGPSEPLRFLDFVEAWSAVTGGSSEIFRADPAWLLGQGVRPFEDIQNWIPESDSEPGFYWISNAKSVAHGLTYRPLEATLQASIESLGDPAELTAPTSRMSLEREGELIAAWRAMSE